MTTDNNTRRMITVAFDTHQRLERELRKLTVASGGTRKTYNDLIIRLLEK